MAVAGLGVTMKVNMIVVMLLIGLGTGIQPVLGYCFGAGNRKRYMAILKFSPMRHARGGTAHHGLSVHRPCPFTVSVYLQKVFPKAGDSRMTEPDTPLPE